MDLFPKELTKIILSDLDDSSRRAARLASKEWFKIIHYDYFVFYGTDLSTFPDIVSRLANYEHAIGINFRNSVFKSDYQKILSLSALTNLTKIDTGFQGIKLQQTLDWMSLSTLTNLQNFIISNTNYPKELLLHFPKLTRLYMPKGATSEYISKVFSVMSDVRKLSVPSSALALMHQLPSPLTLRSLTITKVNKDTSVVAQGDYSSICTRLQNVTNLNFWLPRTLISFPQYLLPNLEHLDYAGASISRLEECTKLTSLFLMTEQRFNEVVPQLAALTRLKLLSVHMIKADAHSLEFLTALTALENLQVSATEVEPIGHALWTHLNAPNLTTLECEATNLDLECTAEISRLTNLVELRIERCTDRHHLSHLTNLQSLKIMDVAEADDSYISKLTNLKFLTVEAGETYDVDQLNLVDLALNLEDLRLSAGITPALYDSLAALSNLTSLSVSQSPAGVATNLLKSLTKLEFLYAQPQDSDEFYSALALATNMHALQLHGIQNEDHLRHLTTLTKLEQMLLIGNVQDKSVREIFSCAKKLRDLAIISRTAK